MANLSATSELRVGSDAAVLHLQEQAKVLRTEVAAPSADLHQVVPKAIDLLDELVTLATAQAAEIRAQRFDGRMTTLLTHYLAALTALALAVALMVGFDAIDQRLAGLIVAIAVLVLAVIVHLLLVRRARQNQ